MYRSLRTIRYLCRPHRQGHICSSFRTLVHVQVSWGTRTQVHTALVTLAYVQYVLWKTRTHASRVRDPSSCNILQYDKALNDDAFHDGSHLELMLSMMILTLEMMLSKMNLTWRWCSPRRFSPWIWCSPWWFSPGADTLHDDSYLELILFMMILTLVMMLSMMILT